MDARRIFPGCAGKRRSRPFRWQRCLQRPRFGFFILPPVLQHLRVRGVVPEAELKNRVFLLGMSQTATAALRMLWRDRCRSWRKGNWEATNRVDATVGTRGVKCSFLYLFFVALLVVDYRQCSLAVTHDESVKAGRRVDAMPAPADDNSAKAYKNTAAEPPPRALVRDV